MLYPEPKWNGDGQWRDMPAFARECGRSDNRKARVPFLLIDAHETLSRHPRGDRAAFARKPNPRYSTLPECGRT